MRQITPPPYITQVPGIYLKDYKERSVSGQGLPMGNPKSLGELMTDKDQEQGESWAGASEWNVGGWIGTQ